jgi:hypothetical protein
MWWLPGFLPFDSRASFLLAPATLQPLALVASPKLGLRHLRKRFQSSPFWEDLISARSPFYTLIGVLLVLVLFLANLMRKVRNILLPMQPETTTRLRATTLHTRGGVLLLYGSSYISGHIFMAPSSLCIPTTSLSNGWWPTISLLIS